MSCYVHSHMCVDNSFRKGNNMTWFPKGIIQIHVTAQHIDFIQRAKTILLTCKLCIFLSTNSFHVMYILTSHLDNLFNLVFYNKWKNFFLLLRWVFNVDKMSTLKKTISFAIQNYFYSIYLLHQSPSIGQLDQSF